MMDDLNWLAKQLETNYKQHQRMAELINTLFERIEKLEEKQNDIKPGRSRKGI